MESFQNGEYLLQRKIDGYHSYISIGTDDIYEAEYQNGKFYIYDIISEKQLLYQERIDMCLKNIKQHINIDFVKTGGVKKTSTKEEVQKTLNKSKDTEKTKSKDTENIETIFALEYIQVEKLDTLWDIVKFVKKCLFSNLSKTIATDGFVLTNKTKKLEDRISLKIKPIEQSTIDFLLKWDTTNQQYNIFTVGRAADCFKTNSRIYEKIPDDQYHNVIFQFKMQFFLNQMSNIYKPREQDKYIDNIMQGELDNKICECKQIKYNEKDTIRSKIIPYKIRFDKTLPNKFSGACPIYLYNLCPFEDMTEQIVKDFEASKPIYTQDPLINEGVLFEYQNSEYNFQITDKYSGFKFIYFCQNNIVNSIKLFQQFCDLQEQTKQKIPQYYIFGYDKLQIMIQKMIQKEIPDLLKINSIEFPESILDSGKQIQINPEIKTDLSKYKILK